MIIKSQAIEGVFLIDIQKNVDERGSFSRIFCERELKESGIDMSIKQINLCENLKKNTLRGMHLQKEEYAEKKILTCLNGKIFDVIIDMRTSSKTYLKYFSVELSEENGYMLVIPEGMAHGYVTLTDDTKLLYYMSEFYNPDSAIGYRFDDPAFSIHWPQIEELIMSDKDKNWKYI